MNMLPRQETIREARRNVVSHVFLALNVAALIGLSFSIIDDRRTAADLLARIERAEDLSVAAAILSVEAGSKCSALAAPIQPRPH